MSQCVIRGAFSEDTVRVYQAYRPEIANPALDAGTFVPPFSMGRNDVDQTLVQLDDVSLWIWA